MSDDKDDFITKHVQKGGPNAEGVEEFDCFGKLKAGNITRAMVELRFKSGVERAYPYSYVVSFELSDEGTIVLHFVGESYRVTGQRLRQVYRLLVDHKLAYLAEFRSGTEPKADAPMIDSIKLIEDKKK